MSREKDRLKRLQESLSESGKYGDLTTKNQERVRIILNEARKSDSSSELRDRATVDTHTFPLYKDWLNENGYLEFRWKKSGGRPVKEPFLLDKGKAVLESEDKPEIEVLEFKKEGGIKATVRLRAEDPFTIDQVTSIMGTISSGWLPPGPEVLRVVQHLPKSKLEKEVKWRGENPDVEKLEDRMWSFVARDALDDLNRHAVRLAFPPSQAFWLPTELDSGGRRRIERKYREFWKEKLENARKGKGELDDYVLLGQIPPDLERLIKSGGCEEWISKHLERNPDFFMPSPYWSALEFCVSSNWTGRVSLPYNTLPTQPGFARMLSPPTLFTFNRVAWKWKENPDLLLGEEEPNQTIHPSLPEEFENLLSDYQEEGEFYRLWRALKELRTPSKPKFKHLEIFRPIEEANLSYAHDSECTDLAEAYSDLREGEWSSVEELAEAISKGMYTI